MHLNFHKMIIFSSLLDLLCPMRRPETETLKKVKNLFLCVENHASAAKTLSLIKQSKINAIFVPKLDAKIACIKSSPSLGRLAKESNLKAKSAESVRLNSI